MTHPVNVNATADDGKARKPIVTKRRLRALNAERRQQQQQAKQAHEQPENTIEQHEQTIVKQVTQEQQSPAQQPKQKNKRKRGESNSIKTSGNANKENKQTSAAQEKISKHSKNNIEDGNGNGKINNNKIDNNAKTTPKKPRQKASANATVTQSVFVDESEGNNTTDEDDDPFTNIPIPEELHTFKALTKSMKLVKLMKIQKLVIPPMLEGKDIIAAAKTGSGKSLAFMIPIIEQIIDIKIENPEIVGPHALVLVPIQELTLQLEEDARKLIRYHTELGITFNRVLGSKNPKQIAKMKKNPPDIIFATPGRLHADIVSGELGAYFFKNLSILVMDEVDQLLDMGFSKQVKRIISELPEDRQIALFSATFPPEIMELVPTNPDNTVKLSTIPKSASKVTVATISQEYLVVGNTEFDDMLCRLLKLYAYTKTIIFFPSVKVCEFYEELLKRLDFQNIFSYTGRTNQRKRETMYKMFRNTQNGMLLCTDVAARGVDMKDVGLILMAGQPTTTSLYVHRSGRTGREGKSGRCITLLREFEQSFVQRALKKGIVFDVELSKKDILEQTRSQEPLDLRTILADSTLLNNMAKDALSSYFFHVSTNRKLYGDLAVAQLIPVFREIGAQYGQTQLALSKKFVSLAKWTEEERAAANAPIQLTDKPKKKKKKNKNKDNDNTNNNAAAGNPAQLQNQLQNQQQQQQQPKENKKRKRGEQGSNTNGNKNKKSNSNDNNTTTNKAANKKKFKKATAKLQEKQKIMGKGDDNNRKPAKKPRH